MPFPLKPHREKSVNTRVIGETKIYKLANWWKKT
jgi:hypothetical protein